MKVWEAIQMLEQMDQTKDVTVTFPAINKAISKNPAPAIAGMRPDNFPVTFATDRIHNNEITKTLQ